MNDFSDSSDDININNFQIHKHPHSFATLNEIQNQYLDQFFDKGVLKNQNQNFLIDHQSIQNPQKINNQDNTAISKEKIKIKSKFHNFQKHLIITLRKALNLQHKFFLQQNEIVRKLWTTFCSKKTYNKSLLRIVFGQDMIEEQLNVKLFKKEGFKNIVDKFEADQIIQAQHSLRKIVLKHLKQNSLEDALSTRKLPDDTKILFLKYFNQFIQQLASGNIQKRLPKSRKCLFLFQH